LLRKVLKQGSPAHERVIWEQAPQVWEQTMRINLDQPFYLSVRVALAGAW